MTSARESSVCEPPASELSAALGDVFTFENGRADELLTDDMLKKYLMAPGPTPVPHEALLAMAAPVIHHRTPQFSAIFREAATGSRALFGTEQPVMMLASSGTGGMEASLLNTMSPGDEVIVVNGGKFGERWGELAETYGLKAITIDVEWGEAVTVDQVREALDANPSVRGVLVQHSETSTTAIHPVQEIAALTRDRDCLLIVDGITSVGVVEVPMDEWGIDVLVTGSQKAMMLPPGLALIALSEKAWRFNETAKLPRYYFDLARERKAVLKDTSAYTPAVGLITGLKAVYDLVEENGGWKSAYCRQSGLADATRKGLAALGLKPLAPNAPSPATTGVWMPESVDGKAFTKYLRDAVGVTVAGGQGKLAGKVIRVSHLGYVDTFDTITALSAIEMGLAKFGHDVEFGRGVAAAQTVLQEMYPAVGD